MIWDWIKTHIFRRPCVVEILDVEPGDLMILICEDLSPEQNITFETAGWKSTGDAHYKIATGDE